MRMCLIRCYTDKEKKKIETLRYTQSENLPRIVVSNVNRTIYYYEAYGNSWCLTNLLAYKRAENIKYWRNWGDYIG